MTDRSLTANTMDGEDTTAPMQRMSASNALKVGIVESRADKKMGTLSTRRTKCGQCSQGSHWYGATGKGLGRFQIHQRHYNQVS